MGRCHLLYFWITCVILYCETICSTDVPKTQTVYMEGSDCGARRRIHSAVVYSHAGHDNDNYHHDVECSITFVAPQPSWRLMLRVVYMDIPDKSLNQLCNDAFYVFDSDLVMVEPVSEAGGITGTCGESLPPNIYSSGQYLTLYFRTDSDGRRGRGFKIIITAFNEDYDSNDSCGVDQFRCVNDNKCIDAQLMCDEVDHCGDYSDESAFGEAKCGRDTVSIFGRFLQLGVSAAIFITVGSVAVFIVCVACIFCWCCKCIRRKPQEHNGSPHGGGGGSNGVIPGAGGGGGGGGSSSHGGSMVSGGPHHTAAAQAPPPTGTSVTINNGGVPPTTVNIPPHPGYHQTYAPHPGMAGHLQSTGDPHPHGYYPMHQVIQTGPIPPAPPGEHPTQYNMYSPYTAGPPHHQVGPPHPGPPHSGVMSHAPSSVHTATPTMGTHSYAGSSPHPHPHPHHSPGAQHHPHHRDSSTYSHPNSSSVYSANPPPSYHRSYTPTSSRSCHSSDSVKYTVHDTRVTANNLQYDKMIQAADV